MHQAVRVSNPNTITFGVCKSKRVALCNLRQRSAPQGLQKHRLLLQRCEAQTMSDIQRFDVGPRLSEMAIYGGVCYLAGQVPEDSSKDAKGQTEEVLKCIDDLLTRAGTDKTRILMAQVFLANLSDFPAMNEAWDAWVVQGHAPPRATVEAKLADPNWKVEIVVTAALK